MAKTTKSANAGPGPKARQEREAALVGKAVRAISLKIPVSEEMIAFLRYTNDEGGFFGIRDVLNALFNTAFLEAYGDLETALRERDGQSVADFLKEAGYLRKDYVDE